MPRCPKFATSDDYARSVRLQLKGYLWLDGKKLMLGFCVDRKLQVEMNPGVKPKDKYESIQIDPNADLPVELILQKLQHYLNLIEKAQ